MKGGILHGILLGLLAMLLLSSVAAVEKKNFKTCQQSGFCRRNRRLSDLPRVSPYSLVEETLAVQDSLVTADILNAESGITFTFELILLQGNRAHFTIKEKNPLKPRFEVQDVIVGKLAPTGSTVSKEPGVTTLDFDGNRLLIQHRPFQLEFFVGKEPVITVNSRGLFNFEHTREKAQIPEAPADGSQTDDLAAENHRFQQEQEKEDAYWEEEFKGQKDSKINGPTAVAMDFTFPGSKAVYGIPEHATSLSLKPTKGPGIDSDPYRLYNLDVFEYELDVPMALYGAIPFMVSHKPDYSVGVLWLNAAETWVDISKPADASYLSKFLGSVQSQIDTHWISESGIIDVYILLGPTPKRLSFQYAGLTGTAQLPPLFSLGYHQCRWNYNDEADVEKVDEGFDTHDIPYDVLWLDIEHTDGKRYFTWDSNKFPDPVRMQENLAQRKRKMVTIVDPHIKRDPNYAVHSEAASKGLYVKTKEGQDFEGHCWPGSSSWIDFLNPEAREWWASRFLPHNYKGSTLDLFTWNDMNEPSVFNGPEVTMHKHNVHHGGWEHRDVHNLYGFYQHMATAEGLKKRADQRPFVLSRAFFAGSQRFGAIWTGDNAAEWGHLKASNPMLLSLNLAGLPFAGADIGGFFGNPEGELLVRWYQTGAFQPFFRGHAHLDTKRREPWLKGEPYTTHIRSAIKTRYTLLPLWYTLFRESSVNGLPVMRPLFYEFPGDEATFEIDDQFLVGDKLLVAPVTGEGKASRDVYLPGAGQIWYDYETAEQQVGPKTISVSTPLSKIPVFVRGGVIIPRKDRPRRSSSLMVNDPYTLLVALNAHQEASGEVYIDDGISYAHEAGEYFWKRLSFKNNVLQAVDYFPTEPADGLPEVPVERVIILGYPNQPTSVTTSNGKSLHFVYSAQEQKLMLKLPEVIISDNWAITIK